MLCFRLFGGGLFLSLHGLFGRRRRFNGNLQGLCLGSKFRRRQRGLHFHRCNARADFKVKAERVRGFGTDLAQTVGGRTFGGIKGRAEALPAVRNRKAHELFKDIHNGGIALFGS